MASITDEQMLRVLDQVTEMAKRLTEAEEAVEALAEAVLTITRKVEARLAKLEEAE